MNRLYLFFIALAVMFAIFVSVGHKWTVYSGIIGWTGGLASVLIAIVLAARHSR